MAFGKFRDKQDSENTSTITPTTSNTVMDAVLKPLTSVKPGTPANTNSSTFIGNAASIVGTLKFDSSAEIGAYIEGEIHCVGRLTILETGVVKGSISASDLIIKGKVFGNIKASNSLALCKPACITGDISSPILSMESGVIFEGKCTMPEIVKKMETPEAIMPEQIKPLGTNNLGGNLGGNLGSN